MKKILVGLFVVWCMTAIKAQELPENLQHPYQINPAAAGMGGLTDLMVSYTSWDGSAKNSPTKLFLMGTMEFKNTATSGGCKLSSESVGSLRQVMAEGSYAFRFKVTENSKLSLGLSGTYNQLGLDRSQAHPGDPNDPILHGAESGYWFDANTGVLFRYFIAGSSGIRSHDFLCGIGVNNLFRQSTSWLVQDFTHTAYTEYTAIMSYTVGLSQKGPEAKFAPKLQITGMCASYDPATMKALVYEADTRLIFSNAFWIGGGYSSGNILKAMAGCEVQNLAFGYTGGWNIGNTYGGYQMPFHGIFLRVIINTSKASR